MIMKKFKVKVKFTNSEHKEKVIYLLVEAADFADAETKAFEYASSDLCGTDVSVEQVSTFKVDLFDCEGGGNYVLLTIDILTIDERSGADKRSRTKALYADTDLGNVWTKFNKYIGCRDAELVKAEMTNFYDVIYAGK